MSDIISRIRKDLGNGERIDLRWSVPEDVYEAGKTVERIASLMSDAAAKEGVTAVMRTGVRRDGERLFLELRGFFGPRSDFEPRSFCVLEFENGSFIRAKMQKKRQKRPQKRRQSPQSVDNGAFFW